MDSYWITCGLNHARTTDNSNRCAINITLPNLGLWKGQGEKTITEGNSWKAFQLRNLKTMQEIRFLKCLPATFNTGQHSPKAIFLFYNFLGWYTEWSASALLFNTRGNKTTYVSSSKALDYRNDQQITFISHLSINS